MVQYTDADGSIVRGFVPEVAGKAVGASNPLPVGGSTPLVAANLTRPANTTTYTANAAVVDGAGGALQFAGAVRAAGGSGIVLGARLTKSSTNATGNTFRLWLFAGAPASVPSDNGAFSPSWANRDLRLGYVDFVNPIVGSDCTEYVGALSQANPIGFKLASGTTLYGIMQALGAYAPASAEIFDVNLQIGQD